MYKERTRENWKVDSEDDLQCVTICDQQIRVLRFIICRLERYTINNVKDSRFLSRLVHYGSIQYQDKLIETRGPMATVTQ